MDARRNVLIVLSGGLGKRMGRSVPKMLIPVSGKPLLYWTLKNLEGCRAFGSIVLVVPPSHRGVFKAKLDRWRFRKVEAVVDGGKERTDSTRNAYRILSKNFECVGVHDAARPFVDRDLVDRCFSEAARHGSAVLAVPSKDTIKVARPSKKGSAALIQETISRQRCWAAQTPQVFRRDWAEKMYSSRALDGKEKALFTDDASIAERLGLKARIVPGSYDNIKVTTPDDLVAAEAILKRGRFR